MTLRSSVALLVLSLLPSAFANKNTPPPQDLIFFHESRLIVIRIELEIDGLSPVERWLKQAEAEFDKADMNADGFWSKSEATPDAIRKVGAREVWSLDDDPCDGQVSFDEIARWLTRSGEGVSGSRDGDVTSLRGQTPLLVALDADGSRSVSENEVLSAFKNLRKRDLNDDGLLTLGELQTRPPSTVVPPTVNDDFRVSIPGGPRSGLPLTSMVRRAMNGDGITAKDLRLSGSSLLQPHDFDQNGSLDENEFHEFVRNPSPDIHIRVQIKEARVADASVVEDRTNRVVLRNAKGVISLVVGSTMQIEIGCRDNALALETTLDLFRVNDADNNGYLDSSELNRTGMAAVLTAFDKDKDGDLYEAELKAGAKRELDVAAAQTRLLITPRGRSLFSVADVDRNLAISRRELASVASRVGIWDRNSDGELTSNEIPETFALTIGPPILPFADPSAMRGRVVAANQGSQQTPRRGQPDWMFRLDQNGDGELSRREFPGDGAAFRQLDKNNDGVISVIEATRPGTADE